MFMHQQRLKPVEFHNIFIFGHWNLSGFNHIIKIYWILHVWFPTFGHHSPAGEKGSSYLTLFNIMPLSLELRPLFDKQAGNTTGSWQTLFHLQPFLTEVLSLICLFFCNIGASEFFFSGIHFLISLSFQDQESHMLHRTFAHVFPQFVFLVSESRFFHPS